MKKIVTLLAVAAMTVSVAFAQDINAVLETYNNGAMELEMGNKEAALGYFQSAITEAQKLGEAGAEIVGNCQAYIPALLYDIANDKIETKQFDAAYDYLTKTKEAAELYGDTAKAAQAKAKMSQVLMQKANTLVKAKDYAGAIAACNQIMADNPDNAMAALLLGQCYSATGNFDKAEEALAIAAANGKEKQANKELSKLFAKKAAVAFNEKKTQLAYDFAVKSNEYLENSRALNIAGKTAMQLGKLEEGLAYLEKYVAAAPNAKDANQMRFNIAAAAQKLGDKEKAKEYYQQILADPKLGAEAKKQLDALNK